MATLAGKAMVRDTTVVVPVRLDLKVIERLRAIGALAGHPVDTVVSVIMAMQLLMIRNPKRQHDRSGKAKKKARAKK